MHINHIASLRDFDIYEYGDKAAQIVLLQAIDKHSLDSMEKEIELIREATGKEFLLAAFVVNDWNKDLSPWPAPAVFGNEDFGDGAADLLAAMQEYCENMGSRTFILGGYSLAGLYSLWSVYQTDIFQGVAAVSPSMWFPEFDNYMNDNKIQCSNVYLSLGDKEEKTKNKVMATVGDKMREAHKLLHDQDINCTLEWNEGNHFRDPDKRTANGFAWIINRMGN
ncbi:MAG: esterase [Butyrivibrio sp.]|nr:esterase [Butyrivibrio sp.]